MHRLLLNSAVGKNQPLAGDLLGER